MRWLVLAALMGLLVSCSESSGGGTEGQDTQGDGGGEAGTDTEQPDGTGASDSEGGSAADAAEGGLDSGGEGADAQNDSGGEASTEDVGDEGAPDTTSDTTGGEDVASDAEGGDLDTAEDTAEADAEGGGGWTPETVPLRGPCPIEERLGGFLVEEYPQFSIVDGKVGDIVNPITVLEEVGFVGGCRLLKKEFPNCDPLCQPGFTCGKSNTCVPFPKQQNVGVVTVKGLEKLVVMEPQAPGNSYFDTDLPQPAFLPGVVLELTSTEGWAGPLELYGIGVDHLELETMQLTVEETKPLALVWSAPSAGARSRIRVTLNIDQHGLSPVIADCDFDDDGSAEIPAEIIDALLDFGVSGFPNARITRRTIDSINIEAGCIDFAVGIPVDPSVTIVGHYPCKTTNECPPPLTCNVPIETCE